MKTIFAVIIAIVLKGPGSGSALSTAAAGLSPGQSVNFTNGTSMSEADFAWQSDGVFDSKHQIVHVMGKPANADQSWKHARYDIAAGQWTAAQNLGWNASGHIYGNFASDPATGDLFQSIGGSKRIRRYDKASDTWTQLSVDIYSGAVSTHFNGVEWHPDLYGPGDGGLVVQDENRTMFWRKSANTVQNFYTGNIGSNAGDALYFAGLGKVVIGQSPHVTVAPNGGSLPTVLNVGAPPIRTGGLSTVYNLPYGGMVQHPGAPSKILLLERRGSHRVWESTDGDNWTLKGFSHPFNLNEFVLVSLPDYGVLWAVGSSNGSILWKPDDSPAAILIRTPVDGLPGLTAWPNPFNSQVFIAIHPAAWNSGAGVLKIFDARGKMAAQWNAGAMAASPGGFFWSGSPFAPGVYMLHFQTEKENFTRRIVLRR